MFVYLVALWLCVFVQSQLSIAYAKLFLHTYFCLNVFLLYFTQVESQIDQLQKTFQFSSEMVKIPVQKKVQFWIFAALNLLVEVKISFFYFFFFLCIVATICTHQEIQCLLYEVFPPLFNRPGVAGAVLQTPL